VLRLPPHVGLTALDSHSCRAPLTLNSGAAQKLRYGRIRERQAIWLLSGVSPAHSE
jgi:LSD1 subclass zinc finger protein